jgi:hypothetical protein
MAIRLDEAGCADFVFSLQTAGIPRLEIGNVSAFNASEAANFAFNASGPGSRATERQKGVSKFSGSMTLTLGAIRDIKNVFLVPGIFNPSLPDISVYHPFLSLQVSPINGKLGEISWILTNFTFNSDGLTYSADTSETMKQSIDFIYYGQL